MNGQATTPYRLLRLMQEQPDEFQRTIDAMPARALIALARDFEIWAHDGQREPSGDHWRVWLILAGRGYGKTRAGAEWVHRMAMRSGRKRIALVGATISDARSVMVEGASGLLAVARHYRVKVRWEPSLGRLRWPTGSAAMLFSGDNADGLRGPEHHYAWCDELAKWREAEAAWDNLQMGLRAGQLPRVLVTTTPRPMPLLERIRNDPSTVVTGGRTHDNLNLPQRFVEAMQAVYGGTRLGRQELDGEIIADSEGTLWPRSLLERCRCPAPREFDRVVVGVDPPAGASKASDACGIVVAGRRGDKLYVLADASVTGLRPEGWARAVADAAAQWSADRVIAEVNNGGAMVESVLRAAETMLPVKSVHASRGKVARAEPVAARFEAGGAFLTGQFSALEDELAGLLAGGEYQGPGRSPDRADAMVWALTELMAHGGAEPRLRRIG